MKLSKIFGKQAFKLGAQKVAKFATEHAEEILTTGGVIGMLSAVGLSIAVTIKATKKVEVAEAAKIIETGDDEAKLTPKEVITEVGKDYIPVVLAATASAVCTFASLKSSKKKVFLLAGTCKALEAAAESAWEDKEEFKKKMRELVGPEKVEETEQELVVEKNAQEAVIAAVASDKVLETGLGNDIFYDPYSGAVFRCSEANIRAAVEKGNTIRLKQFEVSHKEIMDILNVDVGKCGSCMMWYEADPDIVVSFGSKNIPASYFSDGNRRAATIIRYSTRPHLVPNSDDFKGELV